MCWHTGDKNSPLNFLDMMMIVSILWIHPTIAIRVGVLVKAKTTTATLDDEWSCSMTISYRNLDR